MADLDAQLSISADASGVEAGIGAAQRKLADLGKSAATAGKEASKGLEGMGEGAAKASTKVKQAEANLIGSIQRTTAAVEAGSRSNSAYFETLAKQRGVDPATLRPYLSALDEANAKQAAAVAQMVKGGNELNKYGQTARQTAAALRQVPAQLTDIIVGLQGGQAPLTVLLQQGGQLRDVFGGVVPAVRALGGAVLGLINPFTLTAAAAVSLLAAYEKGSAEARAYERALILTGNAAGVTSGQLQVMAQNIDAISGTQAGAAAALVQIASTGAVSAENIERFTLAAIRMEKVGGGSVEELAKSFGELKRAPLEAAIKLNESMNFLTRSTYDQIKALQEQGRTTEAAAVAQRAFADSINSRAGQIEQNLGLIERGWKSIKSAINEAIDAAANIGRTAGPEAQLATAQKAVASLEAAVQSRQQRGLATGDLDRQLAAAKQFVETQQEIVRLGQRGASEQARQAESVKAAADFDKLREQSLTNQEKRAREIAKATELAAKSGASAAELQKVIANINERYKDPKGPDTSRVDARARTLLEIEGIQQAAAQQVNAISNAERILDALRSSGLASETAYYAEKRRLLEETTRVQVSALESENERLSQEKLNTKDSLDRDRKVLENKAAIAKLQAGAATQSIILNAQETAAIQAKTLALVSARQAQEDYLSSLQRQQQRELQGLGMGQRQRDLGQAIGQIEDRYSQQRRDLDNQRSLAAAIAGERGLTKEQAEQFDARARLIDEFEQKAIQSYGEYYRQLTEKERDWSLGASEAIRDYGDEAQNTFALTRDATANAFQGMEDALVTFVTTGKLSFKSLADSIVQDITRIIIKQQMMNLALSAISSLGLGPLLGTGTTAALASAAPGNSLDNFLKLNGNFGTRANGGPVTAGGLYQVNERGPELLDVGGRQFLMMGSQNGRVVPNEQLGGRNFVVNLHQSFAPGTSTKTTLQAASQARRQLEVASRNM